MELCDMDDNSSWYQCKLCKNSFKTTAELQRHNRLNHRNFKTKTVEQAKTVPDETDEESKDEVWDQLLCNNCQYKFDTNDTVVRHLLRQNMSTNGIFKCPYCVKVDLTKYEKAKSKESCHQNIEESICQSPEKSSIQTPEKNLSMRRRNKNKRNVINNQKKSRGVNFKKKRKLSVEPSTPAIPHFPSSATQLPPTKRVKTSTKEDSPANQQKHGFEMLHRRSSSLKAEKSEPTKVSVLINTNPVPSEARLAVPKSKHYEKGNIVCQYCGYQAKSIRDVQFHINTHMSKSYPCSFCSAIYRSKQGVMKHTAKSHPGMKNENIVVSESETSNQCSLDDDIGTCDVQSNQSTSNSHDDYADNDKAYQNSSCSSMVLTNNVSSVTEDLYNGLQTQSTSKYWIDPFHHTDFGASEYLYKEASHEKVVELDNF